MKGNSTILLQQMVRCLLGIRAGKVAREQIKIIATRDISAMLFLGQIEKVAAAFSNDFEG